MTTVYVLLNSIAKVKEFVSITSRCPYDIDVCSGRYVVDGKSIMGIFSLPLNDPLELHIMSDDCAVLLDELSELLVSVN